MPCFNSIAELLKAHPETQYVDACYPDLSCVFRGKRFPIAQAEKLFTSGMMSPGGSFLLAVNGDCMDPDGMGFSDGDPDEVAKPISGTLVTSPWTQLPTAQVMLSFESLAGNPYYFEPRNVLARVIERFQDLEVKPVVAFELEFYLLDKEFDQDGNIQVPIGPLTAQRTGTTQISGEYAPGQFEINLQHTDQLLQAADHCMMFRRVVTNVARKHGYRASFMAKPWQQQSGSGLHLHISLVQAIAGLQQGMGDCMGVFAPNINSYQRFAPNMYVPVSTAWGFENRSVALRIPKSSGAARRIEHRISGADANPYLVLASILSAIHHGISNNLKPTDAAIGNAGESLDPALPFNPVDAFTRCQSSPLLKTYFGDEYIHAYGSCKLRELEEFTERKLEQTDWYL